MLGKVTQRRTYLWSHNTTSHTTQHHTTQRHTTKHHATQRHTTQRHTQHNITHNTTSHNTTHNQTSHITETSQNNREARRLDLQAWLQNYDTMPLKGFVYKLVDVMKAD